MRIDDGRAVPNFMLQALTGEPLTVYGDGSQTRSFCYVDDTVRGLVGLLRSDENEPVNVGNPNEITIKEIAERVVAVTGSDSEIVYQDLPVDDPKVRRPDTKRAQATFDWAPQVDLAEGLKRTLPWFQEEVARLQSE
jgi:dTDP-glucose 4,6-dehydratase